MEILSAYPSQRARDVIMGAMVSQIPSFMIVYSTVYSGADQRKHQSSASLAFVRGIHRWPVNSPHKWPVTRKIFPLDDVIMSQECFTLLDRLPWVFFLRFWICFNIVLQHYVSLCLFFNTSSLEKMISQWTVNVIYRDGYAREPYDVSVIVTGVFSKITVWQNKDDFMFELQTNKSALRWAETYGSAIS